MGDATQALPPTNGLTIEDKYVIMRRLGEGSYGVVCAAKDKRTQKKVAIKKVKNAVEDVVDAKRLLREIKILKHFIGHENVVALKDLILYPCSIQFEDLYIVTELMDTDLLQVIRSSQNLSDEHIRYFVYQVLRALKYFHSANVLHRDLKPNNLLVNENCDLKICDFGLARMSEIPEKAMLMTCYVVTRWYRPPELLLGSKKYTEAIDMWSVGCILAELIGRKALFAGKDYIAMVKLIVNVLGNPTEPEMHFCSEKAKKFLRTLPEKPRTNFREMYVGSDALAIDLLDHLLLFNPDARISAAEALKHPYFAELHDPDDEPISDELFDFDFEKGELSEAQIRELIYRDVVEFQQQLLQQEAEEQAKEREKA